MNAAKLKEILLPHMDLFSRLINASSRLFKKHPSALWRGI
jgi:hypothetical protein